MSRCRRDRTLDCHLGRRRREWLGEGCGAEQGAALAWLAWEGEGATRVSERQGAGVYGRPSSQPRQEVGDRRQEQVLIAICYHSIRDGIPYQGSARHHTTQQVAYASTRVAGCAGAKSDLQERAPAVGSILADLEGLKLCTHMEDTDVLSIQRKPTLTSSFREEASALTASPPAHPSPTISRTTIINSG